MSYVNRAILFTPIGQSDRIPSILDLGSGTGQTDRQTDGRRLSMHYAPPYGVGHNKIVSKRHRSSAVQVLYSFGLCLVGLFFPALLQVALGLPNENLCTLLQHGFFLQAECSSCCPTNDVKALRGC